MRNLILPWAMLVVAFPAANCTAIEPKSEVDSPAVEIVNLFDAIERDAIEVRFIPKDAASAQVLVTNHTREVLHLKLPDTFAAVPVLGQGFGQGFGQNQFNPGGGGGNGGNQSVGGGFQQGGNQGFGNGFGNQGFGNGGQFNGGQNFRGFMRVAPAKTRKVAVTTVCLEHGKPEPRPKIPYRIVPLSEFSDDPQLAAICRELSANEISQNVAQAVAWHLSNGLSWQQLEEMNRVESLYIGQIRFFQSSEIDAAKEFVAQTQSPASD